MSNVRPQVTRAATYPLQCRLSKYERIELGWSEVNHCSKCDHAVFLAATAADANALSCLGQCVKLMREYMPEPIFVGVYEWDPARDATVVLRLALPPADETARGKALEGARLYLNRMPDFARMLECLQQGSSVQMPPMGREEARVLKARFSEWGLLISEAHAV
jgi:hypothetical protein